MESHFTLFRFIQSISPGEEALRAKGHRTLWNPIVNAGVATVDKGSIDDGIARHMSTTRLLQEYSKEDGLACGLQIEERPSSSGFGRLQCCSI